MQNVPKMKKIFFALAILINCTVFAQNKQTNNTQVEGNLSNEAITLIENGQKKFNAGKYNDAIEIFEKLVSTEPTNIAGYYNLSQAYFKNKQYKDCVEICSKALKIDNQENLFYLYRAESNIALNKLETVCDDVKASATTEQSLLKYCN